MILFVVTILLLASFLMALYSLRKELRKPKKEIDLVKEELMHEKVLFMKD